MDNQSCPLHNTAMFPKEGQFGTYHSHIIQNVGFCNGKKITPFKDKASNNYAQGTNPPAYGSTPTTTTSTTEVASGDQKVWDAKDRQSMAQTAMKSASEVMAAMINAGLSTSLDPANDVKTMASELYKKLKELKSEV